MNLINQIGQTLVNCDLNCPGVAINRSRGIMPRGLILEKGDFGPKSIVVGLNPGKCKEEEQAFYRKHGPTYKTYKNFFEVSNVRNVPYFKRTRELLRFLGFSGDILWTNLAKCECSGKNGSLPIQTLRVCINRFLRKEVEAFTTSTMFALGNRAYDFCALSFPKHFVVGLPHPSGSYGNFYRLDKKIREASERYQKVLKESQDIHKHYRAIRLSDS